MTDSLPEPAASLSHWIRGPLLADANRVIAAHGGSRLAQVEVDWSLRGRTAGQARWDTNQATIRLNQGLLRMPQPMETVREVAAHEMAHLCQRACYPRSRAHGSEWQRLAIALGASPRRCHRLPLPAARRAREFRYICEDQVVWLGAVRHRRLQEGGTQYWVQLHGRRVLLRPDHFGGGERWRP